MIFFYLGIGFAMMTTVVAIFETSTAINKNQYTDKLKPVNSDKLISAKQSNIKFLQMLRDIKGTSLGSGQLICQNIKNGFSDELDPNHPVLSNYSILNNYNSGIPSYSPHNRLKNGCDLTNEYHRVIIVPSTIENNSYNLYSCIIDVEPKCPFEWVN